MKKTIELNINNQNQIFEFDYVAKQASGSVLFKIDNAVMIASICINPKPQDADFVPLTVQYIEKSYANRKIPGGYFKREAKPGEFETLTSRIIDRTIRPLFPKGYRYSTQMTLLVVSSDSEVDMQTMALNAATTALYISDIPVDNSVCGVRIGKVDGNLIVNPTNTQLKSSTLDLFVSGTNDDLLMIEMRSLSSTKDGIQSANELNNEDMLEALALANKTIADTCKVYENEFKAVKKETLELKYAAESINEDLYEDIKSKYTDDIKEAISKMSKTERGGILAKVVDTISQNLSEEIEESEILKIVEKIKKQIVRDMILNDNIRADGRGLKDVRNIDIQTNLLPNTHGSCLFTRGQTQALVVTTLGCEKDARMYDSLTEEGIQYEKFMLHYNFPGFSVGAASPIFGVGRRELGHGNLAKRALTPFIDLSTPHTVRLVSEILESNGSSSQATICGGSLALKAAGVKTSKLVAGVAMGLVVEGEKYAILSDIMGLEDHDGDMDFKIAGSKDGISAMQMDIKLGGVSKEILENALSQAQESKLHILGIMEKANEEIVLNEDLLPSMETFTINPNKVGVVIGRGGETIKKVIEDFNVNIDLDRDEGKVTISADSIKNVNEAISHIKKLIEESENRDSRGGPSRGGPRRERKPVPTFEIDSIVDGKVKKLVDFGAFVEISDGVDGLLHRSKIGDVKVNEGDSIKVQIISQENNKIGLAIAEIKKKAWKIF